MTTFSVDTHLFRELGELLVGRDSTALIELIKNSYDADATEVVVYGESLASTTRGFIQIQDNGIGMSKPEFEKGFLRIASRTKDTNKRRSQVFARRYTGAKGIGRLAAHKLAKLIEIRSSRWNNKALPKSGRSASFPATDIQLEASIDWAEIESKTTLDEINSTNAIKLAETPQPKNATAGTTIVLRRLRKSWTTKQQARFLEELQTFEPPEILTAKMPKRVSDPLLFNEPRLRDVEHTFGSQFKVRLEGDLARADDYWETMIDAATWIIEIDANRKTGKVNYAIAPTNETQRELKNEVRKFSIDHPSPHTGPFFQARILKRTGRSEGSSDQKKWTGRSSGVRVYMEGFRVLPYGEPHNDWLGIDEDTSRRGRGFIDARLDDHILDQFERDEDAGLLHLPNKHYFGAVFLTERSAPDLRMLINREGFVPDEGFQVLIDLVRKGIDLGTRVQAADTKDIRTKRRDLRASQYPPNDSDHEPEVAPIAKAIEKSILEARAFTQSARRLAASGKANAAIKEFENAISSVQEITDVSREIVDENAMVKVLASIGTQLASFVHELNGLLDIAAGVDSALRRLRDDKGLNSSHRTMLAGISKTVKDLRSSLERQASFLIDVLAPDSRRRRSRQALSVRFDSAVRLVASAAEKREIKITNSISDQLRSPPMFAAEITALFSNLLTNAVKAAGRKGRIRALSRKGGDHATVIVENSGARVNLREAERWFKPFESSTGNIDPILGQGMGLGLPITRSILEEYGATIKFVSPSAGYSTAVEIRFPA